MNTRRLFDVMALLAVVAMVLAACAPAATPVPTQAPAQPPAVQPTAAPQATEAPKPTEAPTEAPPVTVEWWHITTVDPGKTLWQDMANEYQDFRLVQPHGNMRA